MNFNHDGIVNAHPRVHTPFDFIRSIYRNLFHMNVCSRSRERASEREEESEKPKKIHKIYENTTKHKRTLKKNTYTVCLNHYGRSNMSLASFNLSPVRGCISFEILRFEMSFDFMCYLFCGLAVGDKR